MRRTCRIPILLAGFVLVLPAASTGGTAALSAVPPPDSARSVRTAPSDSARLNRILGLERQLQIVRSGPAKVDRRDIFGSPYDPTQPVWSKPAMTAVGALSEGLVFAAAYQSGNPAAMAAVTAMSMWGGTLRKGIDAAIGAAHDPTWDIEDLHRLSEKDEAVLTSLWMSGGRVSERALYAGNSGFASRKDLSDTLKRLTARRLVAIHGSGGERTVDVLVDRHDVVRALMATGQSSRALRIVNLPIANRNVDERSGTGYGVETEQPGAAGAGGVDP